VRRVSTCRVHPKIPWPNVCHSSGVGCGLRVRAIIAMSHFIPLPIAAGARPEPPGVAVAVAGISSQCRSSGRLLRSRCHCGAGSAAIAGIPCVAGAMATAGSAAVAGARSGTANVAAVIGMHGVVVAGAAVAEAAAGVISVAIAAALAVARSGAPPVSLPLRGCRVGRCR
jgi:hypothetical protein